MSNKSLLQKNQKLQIKSFSHQTYTRYNCLPVHLFCLMQIALNNNRQTLINPGGNKQNGRRRYSSVHRIRVIIQFYYIIEGVRVSKISIPQEQIYFPRLSIGKQASSKGTGILLYVTPSMVYFDCFIILIESL